MQVTLKHIQQKLFTLIQVIRIYRPVNLFIKLLVDGLPHFPRNIIWIDDISNSGQWLLDHELICKRWQLAFHLSNGMLVTKLKLYLIVHYLEIVLKDPEHLVGKASMMARSIMACILAMNIPRIQEFKISCKNSYSLVPEALKIIPLVLVLVE